MEAFKTLKLSKSQEPYPPVTKRLRLLRALREAITTHREQIVEAVQKDYYRPREEVLITEVIPVLSELNHLIRKLKTWTKPKRVRGNPLMVGTRAEIFCEPRGIVLIMAPWNYPFQLSLIPLAQAIGAGNRVILKPSEHSGCVGQVLQSLVQPLLEDHCFVVEGELEVAKQLLELPFDHFFFTGSPRVGQVVMKAAARHHASCTLELGGKSPAIVERGANLKKATTKIAWGKWLNAGQTCIAPDYVLVHETDKNDFISELKTAARMFQGKDYANLRQPDRPEALFGIKASEGRLEPTVIEDTIGSEEIFGPVLPVLSYSSWNDVEKTIRNHPNPLACYLFPGKENHTTWLAENFPSGSLVIDDTLIQASHPGLPFGGVGMSGLGRYHGESGFREFSHEKSILKRTGPGLVSWFYPPYRSFHKRALDVMLGWFSKWI